MLKIRYLTMSSCPKCGEGGHMRHTGNGNYTCTNCKPRKPKTKGKRGRLLYQEANKTDCASPSDPRHQTHDQSTSTKSVNKRQRLAGLQAEQYYGHSIKWTSHISICTFM